MDDNIDHLPSMSNPTYQCIEDVNISIEKVDKFLNNMNIQKLKLIQMKYFQHFLTFSTVLTVVLYKMTGENISPMSKKWQRHIASNYSQVSLISMC